MRSLLPRLLLVAAGLACTSPSSAADVQSGDTLALTDVASREAREITAWVIESRDNDGLPFLIIDKVNAQALAFDGEGQLVGASPVLLGLARGDTSPPGIGERLLRDIRREDRITPAGRFMATLGTNLQGHDILWVDYSAAISLHRVITSNAAEQRLQRLATATAEDNRVSYGCINVPVAFYEQIVRPLFTGSGVVYVLPETRPVEDGFFAAPSAD